MARGSIVYTDSAKCYRFLEEVGYHHETVNHSRGEYVQGQVHENRAEGIWSLLLRWLQSFEESAETTCKLI
jgi:transposase-like protein